MGGVLLIAPLSLLSFHMIYVFLKFVFLNYHSVCQRYRTVSPFGGNPSPLLSFFWLRMQENNRRRWFCWSKRKKVAVVLGNISGLCLLAGVDEMINHLFLEKYIFDYNLANLNWCIKDDLTFKQCFKLSMCMTSPWLMHVMSGGHIAWFDSS